jgi:hypothetical protein
VALTACVESGTCQPLGRRTADLGSEEVAVLAGDVLDREVEPLLLPQAIEAVRGVLGEYVPLHQVGRVAVREILEVPVGMYGGLNCRVSSAM